MLERLRAWLGSLLRSKFVQDTITLQAGRLVLTAVGFATFVVVARLLGPEQYGLYQTALVMHGLLLTFDLTGLGPSTITRLSEAVAACDRSQARALMGYFLQMSLLVAVLASGVAWLFGPGFARASYGNAYIGELMRVYTLSLFLTPLYQLVLLTLQSARAMRAYTALENVASLGESGLRIGAVLLGLGPAGVIAAHLLAALLKAVGSAWLYRRWQRRLPDVLPGFGEVLLAARRNSPRPYWRFGVLLAVDKNLASLFTLLPLQLLGMWASPTEVGFLRLGLGALSYPALLFDGILANLAARLPADVGRRDYLRLQDNFRRVARWIVWLSLGLFGTFALAAPLIVPLLGAEYVPAIPLVRVLCLYGAITGVGGIFGPLYRTLRLMRAILAVKLAALALAALPAAWLILSYRSLGGAWAVNLVYAISLVLTVAVTWPQLRRRAREQRALEGGA